VRLGPAPTNSDPGCALQWYMHVTARGGRIPKGTEDTMQVDAGAEGVTSRERSRDRLPDVI